MEDKIFEVRNNLYSADLVRLRTAAKGKEAKGQEQSKIASCMRLALSSCSRGARSPQLGVILQPELPLLRFQLVDHCQQLFT